MNHHDHLSRLLENQSACWSQGAFRPVEEFLLENPSLDDDEVQALAFNEYVWRGGRGNAPPLAVFLQRLSRLSACSGLEDMIRIHNASLDPSDYLTDLKDIKKGWSEDGARIGNYQIICKVGEGAWGVVYTAKERGAEEGVVAVKVLRPHRVSPRTLVHFEEEANALRRLKHDQIVKLLNRGEDNGLHFLVMEYIDGGNVFENRRELQAGPDCPRRESRKRQKTIATLLAGSARAIGEAHASGIFHMDLTSRNLLLDRKNFRLIVSDFGLARRLQQGCAPTVRVSHYSEPYTAPEVLAHGLRSATADVYGLGAILFELLTGQPPCKGKSPQFGNHVDPGLCAVCRKCLEGDPKNRYQSALDLADDLDRFANGKCVKARKYLPTTRAKKWMVRRPFLTALIAICFVSLLAAGGVWVTGKNRLLKQQLAYRTDLLQTIQVVINDEEIHSYARREYLTDAEKETLGNLKKRLQILVDRDNEFGSLPPERAYSLYLIGRIDVVLQDWDHAIEVTRDAETIFARLAANDPSRIDFKKRLAQCQRQRGYGLQRLRDQKVRLAVELEPEFVVLRIGSQNQLVPQKPLLEPRAAAERKRVLEREAEQLLDEEKAALDDELKTWRELIGTAPADPEHFFRMNLAKSLHTRAEIENVEGRASEAEKIAREELTIWDKLHFSDQVNAEFGIWQADCQHSLARFLTKSSKIEEAKGLCKAAINGLTSLVDEHPTDTDYRFHRTFPRAELISLFSDQLSATNDQKAAEEERLLRYDNLREFNDLCFLNPYNNTFIDRRINIALELAQFLVSRRAGLKDHAAAHDLAHQVAPHWPWRAALIVAQCRGLAESDTALNANEREDAVEGYASCAVEMLQDAVKKDKIDCLTLLQTPDFEPLQKRSDFQRVFAISFAKTFLPYIGP